MAQSKPRSQPNWNTVAKVRKQVVTNLNKLKQTRKWKIILKLTRKFNKGDL